MTVQMAQDEALAMQGAAKFARRVRRRLGFSQAEFATRIDVSTETIRNWEQGKRSPTGAAKALLKVLDKAPEAVLGSLSAAARERDIPVSQVTRSLNRLETACGARLMHRTTHGLSLTDEGDTLLAHGQDMLSMADVLGAELQVRQGQPSGWVRVGVSASVAEAVIAPSLPGLYARYPLLHIDIVVDDRLADMARDGIDMSARVMCTTTT